MDSSSKPVGAHLSVPLYAGPCTDTCDPGTSIQLEELCITDRAQLQLALDTSPLFQPLVGLWVFHLDDERCFSVTVGASCVMFAYFTEAQRLEFGNALIEATGGSALAWQTHFAA